MYVTLLQLAERPGAKELAEVATSDYSRVVGSQLMDLTLRGEDRSTYSPEDIAAADEAAARITQAVEDADAVINGFLAQRGYALPLDPVPGIVATWSRSIARYALHKYRIGDERTDPIARDYRDALSFLQQVVAGKFSLGIGDTQPNTGLGGVSVSTGRREFDDCSLNDFIAPTR
ncbi:MAG: DUF1320 domain-containing protein [Dokdonella sp.]